MTLEPGYLPQATENVPYVEAIIGEAGMDRDFLDKALGYQKVWSEIRTAHAVQFEGFRFWFTQNASTANRQFGGEPSELKWTEQSIAGQLEHFEEVAMISYCILKETDACGQAERQARLGLIAGLVHDLGKLDPRVDLVAPVRHEEYADRYIDRWLQAGGSYFGIDSITAGEIEEIKQAIRQHSTRCPIMVYFSERERPVSSDPAVLLPVNTHRLIAMALSDADEIAQMELLPFRQAGPDRMRIRTFLQKMRAIIAYKLTNGESPDISWVLGEFLERLRLFYEVTSDEVLDAEYELRILSLTDERVKVYGEGELPQVYKRNFVIDLPREMVGRDFRLFFPFSYQVLNMVIWQYRYAIEDFILFYDHLGIGKDVIEDPNQPDGRRWVNGPQDEMAGLYINFLSDSFSNLITRGILAEELYHCTKR